MIHCRLNILLSLLVITVYALGLSEAKPSIGISNQEEPVIPSPNQDFGDDEAASSNAQADIQRRTEGTGVAVAASESTVPIYVSPYLRPERDAESSAVAPQFEGPLESEEPKLSPRPSASATSSSSVNSRDLKAAASYGHGHHGGGHHGHGHGHGQGHGWLDMGAWTGGKGSFGWYADYPVGSKHGKGHY